MKKAKKFKVGDKIVELGKVFKIFKIEEVENNQGESARVIFFKPYYKTEKVENIICSIPVSSVEMAQIRRPITREEVNKLVIRLKKKRKVEYYPAVTKIKDLLKSNDPADMVKILRVLCDEKNEKSENFSKSKRDLFNLAMENLVQEFALVSGVSLEKARERINLALQN